MFEDTFLRVFLFCSFYVYGNVILYWGNLVIPYIHSSRQMHQGFQMTMFGKNQS